ILRASWRVEFQSYDQEQANWRKFRNLVTTSQLTTRPPTGLVAVPRYVCVLPNGTIPAAVLGRCRRECRFQSCRVCSDRLNVARMNRPRSYQVTITPRL